MGGEFEDSGVGVEAADPSPGPQQPEAQGAEPPAPAGGERPGPGDEARGLVREALQQVGEREPGGDAAEGQARGAEGLERPPQPPSGQAPEAQRIFSELGIDPRRIPTDRPEATAQWAAEFAQRFYREHYVPVAEELARTAQEQGQWWERLQGVVESPAYRIAEQLAAEPRLLAAVNEYLQGLGQPSDEAGLPEVNADELDEQGKALYQIATAAHQRNNQLQQTIEQLREELAELKGWRESSQAQAEEQDRQRAYVASGQAIGHAIQRLTGELGFSPTEYPDAWREAMRFAIREIQADLYAWEASGRRGPKPAPDVYQLLRDGCARAGFARLRSERQRQLASRTEPPPDRAESAPAGRVDARELVRSALRQVERVSG